MYLNFEVNIINHEAREKHLNDPKPECNGENLALLPSIFRDNISNHMGLVLIIFSIEEY